MKDAGSDGAQVYAFAQIGDVRLDPWAGDLCRRRRGWIKVLGLVTSVKVVEKDVSEEVAKGQAAMGGSFVGSTSISGSVSSAMPSICM